VDVSQLWSVSVSPHSSVCLLLSFASIISLGFCSIHHLLLACFCYLFIFSPDLYFDSSSWVKQPVFFLRKPSSDLSSCFFLFHNNGPKSVQE
jgi:hypothetical protein